MNPREFPPFETFDLGRALQLFIFGFEMPTVAARGRAP